MPERHSSQSHDDSGSALNPERPVEETTSPVTPNQPPQPQSGGAPRPAGPGDGASASPGQGGEPSDPFHGDQSTEVVNLADLRSRAAGSPRSMLPGSPRRW